jgi:hypothetical protein
MYGHGRIEAHAARVARDAPNRLSERVKLANQSAAYITGGPGDERAKHPERVSIRSEARIEPSEHPAGVIAHLRVTAVDVQEP